MKTNLMSLLLLVAAGCYSAPESTPPASFTSAEAIPSRPMNTAQPLADVVWAMNYDLREFDAVWAWLHTLPKSPERSRALAAATLLGVAELDRAELSAEGLTAFDEAIAAFPTDARLPLWRAYIEFLNARDAHDAAKVTSTLATIRAASHDYASFTLFGLTLAIGGLEDASPELIDEARKAFDEVLVDTARSQRATGGIELDRSRRIWDTPIAPYNIPAMQAMIGDLALRAGKKDEALQPYYTAMNANAAARWPWRKEVQRRLENTESVMAGLSARPATEYAIGSRGLSAMGVARTAPTDRFGGRIGNGSCTVCHTHVSVFDLNEPAQNVGWVKGRITFPKDLPNLQTVAFLLPNGENPRPAGFSIGPFVDSAAPRDFMTRDELYDGTFMIPAEAGRWFVAVQSTVDGKKWQGYLPRELGTQWFLDVKPGVVHDVTSSPIEMKPLPDSE